MARATRPERVIKLLDKLWPGHPVEKMGQEHMVLCPFCDTDKNKCAVNPEKGVFQCWICQERGPIMKLVEHLYKLRHISQKDMEAIKARKGKLKLSDAISVFKRKEEKEPDVLWSKTIPCVFPNNTYAITGFAPQNAIEEKLHTHVQCCHPGLGAARTRTNLLDDTGYVTESPAQDTSCWKEVLPFFC
jgi:hypothetical protein